MTKEKVAIVHDWLYGGGAEAVVYELHKMFPEAPIYTSYSTKEWREKLDDKVVTGYLQHWPFSKLRKFLPVLRQHWFRKLDLNAYDLIISSSGNGEAKFVTKRPGAKHICYCHTPPHFYWRKYEEYLKHPSFRPKWLVRLGLRLLVKPLRKRDYAAAQKVDHFIANSTHIQNDIRTFYDRSSVVIHPPVDVEKFSKVKKHSDSKQQLFIVWGRHVPYKRFDLAIQACNKLKVPLTIIGQGPETENLKRLAGPTITFNGFLSHDELIAEASKASAFLFPGEEDFGIAPVEALALGLPVIAYKSGGALDYIEDGKTGLFFTLQTVESFTNAIQDFEKRKFKAADIRAATEKFSTLSFRECFAKLLRQIEKNPGL